MKWNRKQLTEVTEWNGKPRYMIVWAGSVIGTWKQYVVDHCMTSDGIVEWVSYDKPYSYPARYWRYAAEIPE